MALDFNQLPQDQQKTDASVSFGLSLTTSKVKASERMFFIEQLALMLETGNDLHTSLAVLQKQSANSELARVIGVMKDDIAEGKSFSVAMAKHLDVFSNTYVSLIAASETGGYLQRILEHLLEMEKQRDELRNTLVSAASYPAFLLLFSFATVVFILVAVFPKFADLFTSIRNQLPLSTIFLMSLSDLIIQYWWGLLIGFSLMLMALGWWLRTKSGQQLMDGFKLRMPIFKTLFIRLYLIQIMRVLGLSLTHGVPLIEALDISKEVVKNRLFLKFLNELAQGVQEGKTLAKGFEGVDFFPPMVQQMIMTGEETGNLGMVSLRIADYFQKDLEKLLNLITKIIEPVMLVVMGVVVGILVSSLILPIFKLSQVVH